MLPIVLELFLTFAKIGLFTFGGGYAMIPLIEQDCVDRKKWITTDEMLDITVFAESTPGPIALNASTFVGFRQAGIPGALAASFGVVLPSFVIISLISLFFDHFLEIAVIAKAFQGIKVAVGILIVSAGIRMIGKMKKDLFSVLTLTVCFAAMLLISVFSLKITSVMLMLAVALISLAVFAVRRRGGKGRNPK